MSKTIRRGAPPRRPVQAVRRPQGPRAPSMIDRLLLMLPVSERTLQRIATGGVLTLVLGGAFGLSTLFGVPQAAGVALAEGIGAAGLRVESIDVTGAKNINPMTVYATVLDQKARALPLVDLADVRRRLLRYGWIADAQVSRRLPDKLVVRIIERTPAAVWQEDGRLTLIDANGVPLQHIGRDQLPSLPLLIGEGANRQAADYRALLDAAPAMRPRVKAATWIGNRRWDLLFDSGETLQLPEEAPEQALVKFAEIDGARNLLGKGWLRFDMRVADRLVARKPGPEGARAITDSSALETAAIGNGGEG